MNKINRDIYVIGGSGVLFVLVAISVLCLVIEGTFMHGQI